MSKRSEPKLGLHHQFSHRHVSGAGNPYQVLDAEVLIPALNAANVRAIIFARMGAAFL